MKIHRDHSTSWPVFLLSLMVTLTLSVGQLWAQQPGAIQYVYDDLGRLIKVIDQTGNVAEYVYDAVGNILEIKRSTITGLVLLNFTPSRGPVGTQVTLQGQGFSATPSANTVTFSGTVTAVVSASSTGLVVTVPPGATTGPLVVTVAGKTVVTDGHFTVLPAITTLQPAVVLAGTVIPGMQVQGYNLTGSTFAFTPALLPPVLTITSATIDPTGTLATLQVSVDTRATGAFALVATQPAGSSSLSLTAANTLHILQSTADTDHDGLSNADELTRGTNSLQADTDGDGFSDGEEVEFGSDPLNRTGIPLQSSPQSHEAVGAPVATLNGTNPSGVPLAETAGSSITVLNTINPSGESARETSGPPVSLLNTTNPSTVSPGETSGPTVTVLNTINPSGESTRETSGPPVSLLNTNDPSGLAVREATGAAVSVQNLQAP